ncbi:ABC-F family ATP-binding cassette domain-containing protein [Maricaulis sp. D1M11]|uniref:ABC-F family ATP-binding cassette domain-containing protein n=1 Tax=Maricaulis sp. D1M11 TaxID=3076117 RepID=UPI0039B56072
MSPPLLTLQDIHLTYGVTPLLDGADMTVREGERLCLVGRNGSGKSTLMKVAAGLVEADQGEVFLHPGATVRYLQQDPDLSGYAKVMDYVLEGLAPGDAEYRAQYLLAELGLTGEERGDSLSGGEARRAALARTLAPEPDILLLDEPTNHLDLPVIEWLEGELKNTRSALVLISHDRRFLSHLTRKTLWLDRGQTRMLDKGFGAFEDWRDEVFAAEEEELHKLDRQIVREEHWLRYGVTARRKRNVRRLSDLNALKDKRRTHRGPQGQVKITVADASESGKQVIEAKALNKAFGDTVLVKDFSVKINRKDRIGLVGPNGAGKTTLLKLLTGELDADSGTIKHGARLEIASLDQKRHALKPDWTVTEALTQGGGSYVEINGQNRHVMTYMKDFLFRPEQANTPVHVLSGGEKARLMLARAMALPSNLLVLDEPTNDLDLETLDLLQDMLGEYGGTVFLVSHDRDFLDRVCSTVFLAEGKGKWTEYAGGYSDMLVQRGEGMAARAKAEKPTTGKSPARAKSAPAVPPKQRMANKDRYALQNLPGEIEALGQKIETLETRLAEPALMADPAQMEACASELAALMEERSSKEDQWLELEALREELEGS